ncbi:MAG TPA: TIGR04255 family protein [Streptosporangiaceae bacterium]|nr:TIGR04255 family protein [Streptosporangiaceae bacterium]
MLASPPAWRRTQRFVVRPVGCEVQCEVMEAQRIPKFSRTPVDEVHLHRAPLAKVLMQVQYSRTPQLVTDSAEALIAETLGRYPVRRRQVTAGVVPNVMINGQQLQLPGSITPGVALAFSDPKGLWKVTFTETAVALETNDYGTRDDFCGRSAEIFAAIASVALPPVVDRVGIRYIDRLTGATVEKVPTYVIPELATLVARVEPPLWLQHSIVESQIEIGTDERMLVRSGLLPAGGAFDPALPPVSEPSWVLDMDVFTTQAGFAFEPDELSQRLRRYAETVYAFFRFATTEAFQDAHRGEPAPIAGEMR